MSVLSCILLVDDLGRLLLQERDEHAPVDPLRWGMVGGHVEVGEDPETAAHRELVEETGLVTGDGLELWRRETWARPAAADPNDYHLWAARTAARDEDVVVGEGLRIVFVSTPDIPLLDLGGSARHFLPAFLASATYRRLAG